MDTISVFIALGPLFFSFVCVVIAMYIYIYIYTKARDLREHNGSRVCLCVGVRGLKGECSGLRIQNSMSTVIIRV